MPNRLIHETSPYLLQHAHNPVDWYAWGHEALGKAQKENKPILVSIGYSACHWCHVMERESFENEETAAIMNEHFVNIKVDREERPDIDHIYMDAVQTMTGSGGWPLNVFLTPLAKPFYGGTYFPPLRAYNRSSWKEVLVSVAQAFREKRNELELQAENLTAHLLQSNSFATSKIADSAFLFTKEKIGEAFQNLMDIADQSWGGFGPAPKFPQTFSIQFLLRYYHATENETALKQATLSLDKMIEGGIYDQLGGGFARYSTDKEWLAPHFEKMLYDNALLVSVLSEAYQVTKNEKYKVVIGETIAFIQRDLMNEDGGFYSALDADSEGEEGRYYVWQYDEVKKLLGADANLFCDFFDISQIGNWEGKSILRITKPMELFAEERNLHLVELKTKIQTCKTLLLAERSKRVRPQLDDKILLGWNALMNTACSKAFAATGEKRYREIAVANMNFLFAHVKGRNAGNFRHTAKGDAAGFAFLDDYACLVQALIHLHEITGDLGWVEKSREVAAYVLENFSDPKSGFFFFTDITQPGLILRKKEIYDGATPSGNATMAYNIYRLSIVLDIPDWRRRASEMLASLGNTIIRYPSSFGIWLNLVLEMVVGTSEIAVVGKNALDLGERVLKEYIPHKVLMISAMGDGKMPMLVGKAEKDIPLIYLCKAYSCLKPVSSIPDLLELLHEETKLD